MTIYIVEIFYISIQSFCFINRAEIMLQHGISYAWQNKNVADKQKSQILVLIILYPQQ